MKSTIILGYASQLVTLFWLGGIHHLTWPWPAFSHLGSARLQLASNGNGETKEWERDRQTDWNTVVDKQEMKEAGEKTWPHHDWASDIMSCAFMTHHPKVTRRISDDTIQSRGRLPHTEQSQMKKKKKRLCTCCRPCFTIFNLRYS